MSMRGILFQSLEYGVGIKTFAYKDVQGLPIFTENPHFFAEETQEGQKVPFLTWVTFNPFKVEGMSMFDSWKPIPMSRMVKEQHGATVLYTDPMVFWFPEGHIYVGGQWVLQDGKFVVKKYLNRCEGMFIDQKKTILAPEVEFVGIRLVRAVLKAKALKETNPIKIRL